MGFLLTVLLTWGACYTYVWARVRHHARLRVAVSSPLALGMLVLMVAPIAGIVLSRQGHTFPGRLLEQIGMLWTGWFFLFLCLSLIHDGWNVLATLVGVAYGPAKIMRLTGRRVVLAEVLLITVACLYAMVEARWIRVRHVVIPVAAPIGGRLRTRIVQITDLHLGHMVGESRLRSILRHVEAAKPDTLISTGDLVDTNMIGLESLADMLAAAEAPLGAYAVTGNHEYYAGLDQALDFHRRAGFRVLMNETVSVCDGLTLVGVEDEAARQGRMGPRYEWDEGELLRRAPSGDFVVLLKHRPLVDPESAGLFGLQLSGHTHGGQMFPFSLIVAAVYEHGQGLVKLPAGSFLYTSLGSGTWGPPMRLLRPPEVTVLDLVADGDP